MNVDERLELDQLLGATLDAIEDPLEQVRIDGGDRLRALLADRGDLRVLGRLGRSGLLLRELLERRLAPPFYRNTEVVTLSESSRRELLSELRFRPERVRVVEPGIDRRFSPGGPDAERPLVLSVSRLMAPKRFDVVIRVAAEGLFSKIRSRMSTTNSIGV